ncbi:PREDICTED: anomalous homeobox protein-like [Elephantulus edwardii]|uniref:anomalous homeobox protein-like n=1 Tax=Elephantulus edwardii TaxID=28737 RepID=UPI0003F0C443|nr:PREDICTED: anomalous homeobox protein-like [Elephantulus edwardii]
MQKFLAMLEESRASCSPSAELVALATRLCRDLRDNLAQVTPLAEAVLESPLRPYLLDCKEVALVCALVLAQQEQFPAARRLLEECQVPGGSSELVELWNDIHYRQTMKGLGVTTLTPVQKFRCRKRYPPPPTLCPEGLRGRNFPRTVRLKLQDFASRVSANPDKAQREALSSETELSTEQVYNWFANYRRKQRARQQHSETLQGTAAGDLRIWKTHQEHPQPSGDETKAPPQPPKGIQGPCTLLVPTLHFAGSEKPEAPRSLQSGEVYQEEPGQDPASFASICPGTGLYPLEASSRVMDPSLGTPASWLMPLALASSMEGSFQTGQLVHDQELNFSLSSLTSASGLSGPASRNLQGMYQEGGPGPSSGHMELQTEYFLASHRPLHVPAAVVQAQSSQEPVQAMSCFPHSVSNVELSPPQLSGQVQCPDSPASNDAFWGAQMLFEFSGGNLKRDILEK